MLLANFIGRKRYTVTFAIFYSDTNKQAQANILSLEVGFGYRTTRLAATPFVQASYLVALCLYCIIAKSG